jgi:hypothetical protein
MAQAGAGTASWNVFNDSLKHSLTVTKIAPFP